MLQPSEMERIGLATLCSRALGIAVYLWLHLRATRLAVTQQSAPG